MVLASAILSMQDGYLPFSPSPRVLLGVVAIIETLFWSPSLFGLASRRIKLWMASKKENVRDAEGDQEDLDSLRTFCGA